MTEVLDAYDFNLSVEVFKHGQALCEKSIVVCAPYHYLRPILRRLGVVTSPYTHASFYREALTRILAANSESRIAISGMADYGWLLSSSPLIEALKDSPRESQVTVSDACPTPVHYSLVAAQRLGVSVVPRVADLRRDLGLQDQDVIVTDAFLTQFSDKADRLAVLHQWHQWLRIGGVAVTTVQVRGAAQAIPNVDYSSNIAAIYARSTYPDALDIDEGQFRSLAQNHTTGRTSRVYQSEQELIDEVGQSGFSIQEMQSDSWHSPVVDRDLSYREIILEKTAGSATATP